MTNMRLYHHNYFWANKTDFSRQTILIQCCFSHQKQKLIKTKLQERLGGNVSNKALVYSSSSKGIEVIGERIDSCMNYLDTVDGDTIVIQGDLELDWKFVSAAEFTKSRTDISAMMENNEYYPRILCATSGCIETGLDSNKFSVMVSQKGY